MKLKNLLTNSVKNLYNIFKAAIQFYFNRNYIKRHKYEVIENHKNDAGENIVVVKINDSLGKVFKLPVLELINKRKDILEKFSVNDIVNIVGLASTMYSPIIVENKSSSYRYFAILAMLFGAALITSNIASSKLTSIFGIIMTGGTIPYAFTYSLGDIITEVYGYKRTRQLIWGAIASNVFVIAFIYVTIFLPPASFWHNQQEYQLILGTTVRIIFSSLTSYWCSEFLNSYVLAKLKIYLEGKYLWMRILFSSMISITADTIIFTFLAYFGTLPTSEIIKLLFVSYTTSFAWEFLTLPFLIKIINYLKKVEILDIFDANTNFTPFSLDVSYLESNNLLSKK
jgi:uncharacterized integral membrane protein (TIGR00697 family)